MEIKFRAWTGSEMILPNTLFIGAGSSAEIIEIALDGMVSKRNAYGLDGFSKNPAFDEPENIVLMQFTGLTDRHGKDIYAGDIVNEDLATDGKWQSVGVVEFYEGSFGSRNEYDRFRIPALFTGSATEGMNLNYYEIIGNIYQNPELIPEKITK